MKKYLPYILAALPIVLFLVYKISGLVLHFGDGNAYLYMADSFWHDLMPYRDYFFADPPVALLVLAFLKLLFGNHLVLFQLVPLVCESITAVLLFLLLRKWNNRFAWLAPLFYLFSFAIISTSDFLTGVQLVVLLTTAALWSWENNHSKLSGIFWALAILTKLYAAPFWLAFLLWVWLKAERKKFWPLLVATGITGLIVFLPFFVLAPRVAFNDLVVHQLHRPAGNGRWPVWSFFLIKDWLLIIVAAIGAMRFRRWFILAPGLATLIFFIAYRDLYYLYLVNLLPYLILFWLTLLAELWHKPNWRMLRVFLLVGYGAMLLTNFTDYANNFGTVGRFENAAAIAAYVKTLPADAQLYGSHEVAPLIALMANRKLFANQIDTNTQAFASGALDLETISTRAAAQGVYLIARITDQPDLGISDFGYQGYFSEKVFKTACQRQQTFPSTGNENDNHIVIYYCKN